MIAPDEVRDLVRRHIQLWRDGSHVEWRACFAPDYAIEDPVGTGLRVMGSYLDEWNNMHSDGLHLDMEAYRLIVGGNEIVADLRAVTHLPAAKAGVDAEGSARHTLSYTGIYTARRLDGKLLLSANRTFADPVPDELWHAFYPSLQRPAPPPRSPAELRQGVEDHLYYWNRGNLADWRRRFTPDATLENPVGSGASPLGDGSELWNAGHAAERQVRLGCHRTIPCGREVLVHGVASLEVPGAPPRSVSTTEILCFDEHGFIRSWRVFRDPETEWVK